jgi:hypothetical protein
MKKIHNGGAPAEVAMPYSDIVRRLIDETKAEIEHCKSDEIIADDLVCELRDLERLYALTRHHECGDPV